LELAVNSGQAFAYRTGYKVAMLGGFKYVLHLDADGQYNPEELHLLLNPLIKGEADFVSGSRLLGAYEEKFKNNNVVRSIGVYFFNFVLRIITGYKVTDSASGFRGITVNVLSKLQLEQTQFHSSELLIEAVKKGATYTEVGVSFNRRFAGKSKKPSDFSYAVGFTKAIIKSWFRN
jgi:glycosyltransferase involved in cell wall biosynthesis